MMNNVTGVTLSSELINDMKKLLPAQGEADDGLEELQKFVGKERKIYLETTTESSQSRAFTNRSGSEP